MSRITDTISRTMTHDHGLLHQRYGIHLWGIAGHSHGHKPLSPSWSKIEFVICLLVLIITFTPAYSQKTKGKSKQQLQNEITNLQNEISTANQLLKKTTKDKEMTLNEVNLLDKKIKQREKLIKAYNEQIAVLDEEIQTGQSTIKALNSDLSKLQKEYAKMVTFANKNRSHYDRLGFIFASKDFNQAFSRLRYIREFSDARKVKMEQISSTQRQISNAVEASQQAREEQNTLLKDEKTQQEAMKSEKDDLNKHPTGHQEQATTSPKTAKSHRRHHRRRD